MKRLPVLVLLALGACSTPPQEPPAPAPAPPPAATAPPPRSPVPAPPTPARDACGAAAAQRFVGRPRSEIPIPVNPGLQRVACTTCPVTLDFNPQRLNFFFDAATGIIKDVRCG